MKKIDQETIEGAGTKKRKRTKKGSPIMIKSHVTCINVKIICFRLSKLEKHFLEDGQV